jgi:hypothetical protein
MTLLFVESHFSITSWTCFGVGWKNQVFSAYGSLDLFPLARCLEENGIGIWIIEKQVSILFPSHRSVRKWIKRIGLFIIHCFARVWISISTALSRCKVEWIHWMDHRVRFSGLLFSTLTQGNILESLRLFLHEHWLREKWAMTIVN